MKVIDVKKQIGEFRRGVVDITTFEELERKIAKGVPLRVKLGVDPTAPDIHLGHTVVLRKLRQFQDLGHKAVLIIGDFTGLIGDPSGRTKTRPQLSVEELEVNAKTYLEQVGKVLDMETVEIRRNSEWLKPLTFAEIMWLAGKLTVSSLLERRDFAQRFENHKPIGLHEFMYPLMQAYDSVVVKADVELGGSDQIFNLLAGRWLQVEMRQEAQIAVTMPLLLGTNGVEKMSKSYGNHIGVSEPTFEMYSKVMSIADGLMKDYFTLLTNVPLKEVEELLVGHPMTAKKRLAHEIVTNYHSEKNADEAAGRWESVMSKKEVPSDTPTLEIKKADLKDGKIWIVQLVAMTKVANSNSDVRRLIEQGGVELGGEKISDSKANISIQEDSILKIGKKNRYFRLKVV
ncbi:MAG: tyrosine--tRNA ligase [Planctomycetes bacterium RBG_16_43_13]|nr:MAG: tyrosine--tRNA ligase [Planctomycetes bacterium RBG_16_43_13]